MLMRLQHLSRNIQEISTFEKTARLARTTGKRTLYATRRFSLWKPNGLLQYINPVLANEATGIR